MSQENNRKDKYLNDPRTTEELIELALENDAGDERHIRRDLIKSLQYRATYEVFEAAKTLCESTEAKQKKLGADILGWLGTSKKTFLEESLPVLFNLISEELEDEVLCIVINALGRLEDERLVEHVVKFKNHPNEFVRSRVVSALRGQTKQEAINALIELSNDWVDDIRHEATYEIAMIKADTPEIREALFQRLNEKGNWILDAARKGAICGLARRKDERAFGLLLKELEALKSFKNKDSVQLNDGSLSSITIEIEGYLLVDAAKEFADPRLLSALLQLKEFWDKDYTDLKEAIAACQGKTE